MAVNKVIYGGNTVIDLTSDSVTPDTLAEGAVAHDKSGAVIHGRMAVIKRTPYWYDDADQKWYDNSEGMYSPDYNLTCPKCGAWLQAGLSIDWSPIDTNCPICNLAITLTNGSVEQRGESVGGGVIGGTYFFDVVDQMWWENSDGTWSPDYPDMSCPFCGAVLQSNYDIDENPQYTNCPSCCNPLVLVDGTAAGDGDERKWLFRNVVFDTDVRYDLPSPEEGKDYTILVDGVEGSTGWCDGTWLMLYADMWESFMALIWDNDEGSRWNCQPEYQGKKISVYEYT